MISKAFIQVHWDEIKFQRDGEKSVRCSYS